MGTTDRYNLALKQWTRLSSLYPGNIELSAQCICTFNGQLYVTGGYYDTRDVTESGYDSEGPPSLVYNPYTYILEDQVNPGLATWKPLPHFLIQNRAAHASIVFKHKLLIGGGVYMTMHDEDMTCEVFSSIEAFDGNSWKPFEPQMSRKRVGNDFIFFVIANTLYAAGGEFEPSGTFSIEHLNPFTNQWELDVERSDLGRSGCCCTCVGSRVYLFGGGEFHSESNCSWDYYDLNANKWASEDASIERSLPKNESRGEIKHAGSGKAVFVLSGIELYD